MSIFNSEKPLVFDGAMGTMLQNAGLPAGAMAETMNNSPEIVLDIHRAYIRAGANVISSNTFSANKVKMKGMDVAAEVKKGVALARNAADKAKENGNEVFVAADFGPTGKLMSPLGDFSFDEAYDAFKDSVIAAEESGADLVFFETFSDLYECKAAILAVKENTSLPVAVSLTFDESGRTLTGADAETVVAYLSALGVDAIGVNCGLGPDAMEPIAIRLAEKSGLPVIVNANAGLPKIDQWGETYFDVPAERFYSFAEKLVENGIFAVGGCCGTTPEYISRVAKSLKNKKRIILPKPKNISVCSGTRTYTFSGKTAVVGERLNPTGKPKLKNALKEGNMDYLCNEAVSQQAMGADILDVNVGIPDINESQVLPRAVMALQGVTDLPLQLDSADPDALAAAARIYNGIPIINSVSGKEEILDSVLPIVKKYGGMCVALLLDDVGIPATAKGRIAIAEKIIARGEKMGIPKERFLFDALTMTVATDAESGNKTLECVKALSDMGLYTALGVSNISYGMPNREAINASFLGAAMARGLSAAIINPASETSRTVIADEAPDPDFRFDYGHEEIVLAETKKGEITLYDAVFLGLSAKASEEANKLLETNSPLEIIESQLIPALNALGKGYEEKSIFLPRLLGGAEAAKSAFKAINSAMQGDAAEKSGVIVMATVQGDIHDIGKNIVVTLLSNYGFDVIDLGKDVSPEKVLESVLKNGAFMVGLSALMTTTVPAMAETVRLIREKAPDVKIMVGGAVMTDEYARSMGADFYGADAMAAVKYAKSLV